MGKQTTVKGVRYANTRRVSHILWWVDRSMVRDPQIGDGFWLSYCGGTLNVMKHEDVTDQPRRRLCYYCERWRQNWERSIANMGAGHAR